MRNSTGGGVLFGPVETSPSMKLHERSIFLLLAMLKGMKRPVQFVDEKLRLFRFIFEDVPKVLSYLILHNYLIWMNRANCYRLLGSKKSQIPSFRIGYRISFKNPNDIDYLEW